MVKKQEIVSVTLFKDDSFLHNIANMSTINWFDRKCDFTEVGEFRPLLSRLQNTPCLLQQLTADLPGGLIRIKPGNKWSVLEHIGHLIILEPVWQLRFKEIGLEIKVMFPADLENKATDEADFNGRILADLLEELAAVRRQTIDQLNRFEESAFTRSSIHPRLLQPMRITDMMFFVAEHDDHHLNAIKHIINHNRIKL